MWGVGGGHVQPLEMTKSPLEKPSHLPTKRIPLTNIMYIYFDVKCKHASLQVVSLPIIFMYRHR